MYEWKLIDVQFIFHVGVQWVIYNNNSVSIFILHANQILKRRLAHALEWWTKKQNHKKTVFISSSIKKQEWKEKKKRKWVVNLDFHYIISDIWQTRQIMNYYFVDGNTHTHQERKKAGGRYVIFLFQLISQFAHHTYNFFSTGFIVCTFVSICRTMAFNRFE